MFAVTENILFITEMYLHLLYPVLLIQPTAVPGPPQELSVEYDESTETITITWGAAENSGQFDLDIYTVNVTSSFDVVVSVQVHAATTTLTVDLDRQQTAALNVTVTATNMCGQTGSPALEYITSKVISHPLY